MSRPSFGPPHHLSRVALMVGGTEGVRAQGAPTAVVLVRSFSTVHVWRYRRVLESLAPFSFAPRILRPTFVAPPRPARMYFARPGTHDSPPRGNDRELVTVAPLQVTYLVALDPAVPRQYHHGERFVPRGGMFTDGHPGKPVHKGRPRITLTQIRPGPQSLQKLVDELAGIALADQVDSRRHCRHAAPNALDLPRLADGIGGVADRSGESVRVLAIGVDDLVVGHPEAVPGDERLVEHGHCSHTRGRIVRIGNPRHRECVCRRTHRLLAHHELGPWVHTHEDEHGRRDSGVDNSDQAVLTIEQEPVGRERDCLMREQPSFGL